MLGKCGIVPQEDVDTIKDGLHKVLHRMRRGEVEFSISDEDIHMNIEKAADGRGRSCRRQAAYRTQS